MRDVLLVVGAEVPSGRAVALKLRMEHYCCKLISSDASLSQIAEQSAAGIILAGEESEGAMPPDPGVMSLGMPVLALGSSARTLLSSLGNKTEKAPFVQAVAPVAYQSTPLFQDVEAGERWIGRAEMYQLPETYQVIADGAGYPLAFANHEKGHYLLQFQIERNDPDGMAMLLSFADAVCGCTPWWTVDNMIGEAEKSIRQAVGESEAVCALSGGLDSTVAALLAKRALGGRVRCVFVDTGLLRQGEADESQRRFNVDLRLECARVDASATVFAALAGLTDAGDKWRVIDREIKRAILVKAQETPGAKALIRGTNYVDVLGEGDGVEEAPDGVFACVVEPLRELFKEEIKSIGESLQLSPAVLGRQPFPGVGLAARIEGEVTENRLNLLRQADAIFCDLLRDAGLDKRLSRFFVMLSRVNGQDAILLRAMQGAEPAMNVARLPYDMLERAVERLRQMNGVQRVYYDMTPGFAEWANPLAKEVEQGADGA